jgi:hypothetical protein
MLPKKEVSTTAFVRDHVVSVWHGSSSRSIYLFEDMTRKQAMQMIEGLVGEAVSKIEFADVDRRKGYVFLGAVQLDREE